MYRLLLVLCCVLSRARCGNLSRYGFFRELGAAGGARGSRRVFGGVAARAGEGGSSCVLLDRYWGARCSGSVLAPRWVLTAAHCVTPRIAYVKYNARRHPDTEGDVTPVHFLYMHPGYKVVQEDEGRGMDVTLLHHDVGLVRTRSDMRLVAGPPRDPLATMKLYDPERMIDEEVQVFGFGRTERSVLGEELSCVRLSVAVCGRGSWVHCACGAARELRGVCAGDSGGPVLYRGVQIGVTSMGPVECGGVRVGGDGGGGSSVFTTLRRYADVINATIHDTDSALQMRVISEGHIATHYTLLLMFTYIHILVLQ